MLTSKFLLSAIILGSCAYAAQIKELLFDEYTSNMDEHFLSRDIRDNQPSAKVIKYNKWTKSIPFSCYVYGQAMNCPAKNIEVWETTYEDCQEPWTFCRCKDSAVTQNEMVEEFGRIPVALRENVVNVMSGPAGALAGSAHVSPGTDVTFQGSKASMSPLLVMHQVGHLLDWFSQIISYKTEFQDAVMKDSCWMDKHAKEAGEKTPTPEYQELWSQALVIHWYQVVMKGPGNLPDNWKCMKNQLDVIASQSKDLFGRERCDVSNKKKQTNVIEKSKLPPSMVTGAPGLGFPMGICQLRYPGQM
ncbi:hypothetical protein BZA77DRAFT_372500 [Pyronema omphalodes]|nr:hypothetical protein BZA77DRAFT_372500 [Pyronema omphalodes]